MGFVFCSDLLYKEYMVKSNLSEKKRLFLLAGEMAGLGALAVIILVFIASTLAGYLIRSGEGAAVITAIIADLTNTDRRSNNIGELHVNPTLTAIAQAKANDMAEKGYFAHTSPEGKSPWYWFKQGGYTFTYAGENLAVDFSDSADVERAWMNSPTHRANLLNDKFTEIGIATAVGTFEGRQTTFVVQEFGTPAHKDELQDIEIPTELTKTSKPTDIAIAVQSKPKPTVENTKKVATTTATLAQVQQASSTVLGSTAEGLTANETIKTQGINSLWNVFAASPRSTLKTAYYLFGFLILIALIIETGVEIKRHHLRHVALTVALLVLMGGLFLIADAFVFTDPVLAESTLNTI